MPPELSSVTTKVAARIAATNAARAQFLGCAFAITFALGLVGDALGMGSLQQHGYMIGQLLGSLSVAAIIRFTELGTRYAGPVFAFGMSGVCASGAAHLAQFGGLDGPYFYGVYTAPPIFIPMLFSLPLRIAATLATVLGFVLVYWTCLPTLFEHPMAHIPVTYLLTISGIAIALGQYVRRLEVTGFTDVARLELAADALERQLRTEDLRPAQLRHEVARQLHDDVAQLITGARIHFDGWSGKRPKDDVAAHLGKLLDELAQRTHRMLDELREPPAHESMAVELERLRGEYAALGLAVDVLVDEGDQRTSYPQAHARALVAIVREALTNALRHGRSSEATISVRFDPHEITLDVFDNGGGRVVDVREGYGLIGIRERAASLGGVALLRDYEEGLRLSVRLPRTQDAGAATDELRA